MPVFVFENVLMEHGAVNECAVVGEKIEGLLKPFAFVTIEEHVAGTEKERDQLNGSILEFAAGRLPNFKRPWKVLIVDELPKTGTGKIQRFRLRDQEKKAALG